MSTFQKHLAQLEPADIRISKNTMIKYINELEFGSYIKVHKPGLTADHKVKCLQ
jgi:hypothetical protein